ncbi:EamA family transporter [Natronorubrum sp. JWXQ-INN-674]|uniref:EamA family transporter n=2 Tax=Natronorubrum halalkaliphilum TaxID=2691917 RepID=A0A6B0VN94_9EURY|nr:EamA family transporter [Natronorubrum halalkaliphilum]
MSLASMTVILRKGTDQGTANSALVVVLVGNIVVFVPAAFLLYYPDLQITSLSFLTFVAAGLFGTMLGRAFYYTSIERIGANRSDPIRASQPLYATVIAVIVLGEVLTLPHFIGILLMIGGVAMIVLETSGSAGVNSLESRIELALPIIAAIFFGIEPVFARIGLQEGTPVFVGLAIKTLVGTIGFLSYLAYRRQLPGPSNLLGDPNTPWYIGAAAANSLFLLAYYTALEVSRVVVVVPIVQMTPMIVILLSFIFLPRLEIVTARLITGAGVIISGAVLITVYG